MSNKMRPRGRVQPKIGHSPGYATGHSSIPKDYAKMPAKHVGKHRWEAIAQHSVTDDQARAFSQGSAIKLDGTKMFQCAVGCCDCGQDYVSAFGTECPGILDADPAS